MRNFILVFIEVVYAVIQHPGELPVYLRRIPRLRVHVGIIIAMAAVSTAAGIYFLRDYYLPSYWLSILFLTAIHALLFLIWGLLLGSVVDAIVKFRQTGYERRRVQIPEASRDPEVVRPDRSGQVWPMISIVMLSAVPLCFFLPVAVPARFIGMRLGAPSALIMLPFAFLLYGWSMFIALKGLQFLYEISLRDSVMVYLRAMLAVLAFPAVTLFFAVFEIYHLFF